MNVTLDERVRAAAPALALGIVEASVPVRPASAALRGLVEATVARLAAELAGVELPSLPEIAALRRFYRALGKDPTRYRGSSEALLRRVVQGRGLYSVSNAVDVCNLVSLETRHALGAYDLAKIDGPVLLRPAAAGEVYQGVGRGELNLEGLPVFCDARGPFGSPTSDSERTSITEESRRIALVIVACCRADRLEQDLARTSELLGLYASGEEIATSIVTA